jgi:heme-degrading monooxygenase HmoA
MVFVSLTRLRVRSFRYLLQFIWRALKAARQAEGAEGFLGGRLLREARNTFWTITAWESEASMRAYRGTGAHRTVMPKLLEWCDEASVAHWTQESLELPSWQEAHQRMLQEGRVSKVKHPSAAQESNRIAAPRPGRIERTLNPQRAVQK